MSFYPTYQEQFNKLDILHKEALERIPFVEDIEGWLLLVESAELLLLAEKIKNNHPVICEIGSWKGKSSYIFATALKNRQGILYAVDPFDGDGDSASKSSYQEEIKKLNTSLLQNFKKTMEKYNLLETVKIIPFLSSDARKKFFEKRIDLLFIDGNHDYSAVKEDYLLWSPLVPSGGRIILHDFGAAHVDGPKRVAKEFILESKEWIDVQIVGEMIVATKH